MIFFVVPEEDPSPRPQPLSTDSQSPLVGVHMLVQCEGFSCVAYLADDGKWKRASNHQELPKVLKVIGRV